MTKGPADQIDCISFGMVRHPDAVRVRAYAAWVFVCIVWGTTYLAIRICLETVPPLLMGGFRYIVAGLLLIAWLLARGEALPRVRAWPSLARLGALMLACGNGGVVWAEQTIASGLTAVLVRSEERRVGKGGGWRGWTYEGSRGPRR